MFEGLIQLLNKYVIRLLLSLFVLIAAFVFVGKPPATNFECNSSVCNIMSEQKKIDSFAVSEIKSCEVEKVVRKSNGGRRSRRSVYYKPLVTLNSERVLDLSSSLNTMIFAMKKRDFADDFCAKLMSGKSFKY